MRKLTLIFGAASVALTLTGCASSGYHRTTGVYVTGYYDGYYGPYRGGYWSNGYFYYLDRNRHYQRDVQSHFRRDRFDGGHRFQSAQHDDDRDHRHDRRRDRDRDHDHDHDRDYD
jgi:hypothetical protein